MGFTDVTIRAFLGLGSNTGDREAYLDLAMQTLHRQSHIFSIHASSVYETSPWGLKDQALFLNQVLEIQTAFQAEALLDTIREIEAQTGRQRDIPWGPRTLDIDVLLYGNLHMRDEHLIIPHPRLHLRRFVLVPLAEVAPEVWVPGIRMTVRELLDQCPDDGTVTVYRK